MAYQRDNPRFEELRKKKRTPNEQAEYAQLSSTNTPQDLTPRERKLFAASDLKDSAARKELVANINNEPQSLSVADVTQNQKAEAIQQGSYNLPIPQEKTIPVGQLNPKDPNANKLLSIQGGAENVAQVLPGLSQALAVRVALKDTQTGEVNPNIQTLGLNNVDYQVLADGQARVSTLGTIIESLPAIRGFGRWSKLTVLPQNQVDELLTTLDASAKDAGTYVTQAMANPYQAPDYKFNMMATQAKIKFLESRIKLITLQSPYLQAHPEEVANIQVKIKDADQALTDALNKFIQMGL